MDEVVDFILGIDFGTTTLKGVIVERHVSLRGHADNGDDDEDASSSDLTRVVASVSRQVNADLTNLPAANFKEQDPIKIIQCLATVMDEFPTGLKSKVSCVGSSRHAGYVARFHCKMRCLFTSRHVISHFHFRDIGSNARRYLVE